MNRHRPPGGPGAVERCRDDLRLPSWMLLEMCSRQALFSRFIRLWPGCLSKALFYQKDIDYAGTSARIFRYSLNVYVLLIECSFADKELLLAELWERGTSGVVEQDLPGGGHLLRGFFDERFDAGEWAARGARWEQVEDRDWVEVSQSQWKPVLVGARFFLAPEWRHDPTPAGRIRLEMRPRLACGTGWGAATQLALEGLERKLRPGATVLDLGTGSGLLAVAAARLGAGRIYACDIDPEATRRREAAAPKASKRACSRGRCGRSARCGGTAGGEHQRRGFVEP